MGDWYRTIYDVPVNLRQYIQPKAMKFKYYRKNVSIDTLMDFGISVLAVYLLSLV